MPCRDAYPSDYDVEVRKRLDLATRVACTALSRMTASQISGLPKEVQYWWTEHQAADRLRQEREAAEKARQEAKRRALAKLSPAERKVLGL